MKTLILWGVLLGALLTMYPTRTPAAATPAEASWKCDPNLRRCARRIPSGLCSVSLPREASDLPKVGTYTDTADRSVRQGWAEIRVLPDGELSERVYSGDPLDIFGEISDTERKAATVREWLSDYCVAADLPEPYANTLRTVLAKYRD